MPEEAQQAVDETTPASSAPEEERASDAQTQPDIDWQKRYEDQRSEFDRRNSELEELRPYKSTIEALYSEDPDERKRASDALGLQFVEEEPEPELDELESLKKEIEALKESQQEFKSAREEEARREQMADYLHKEIAALEKHEGLQLSEDDAIRLARHAETIPNDQGLPNVKAAWEDLTGFATGYQQHRMKAKKAPQVRAGKAGEKAIDLNDKKGRLERMAARIEAESE